MAKQFQLQLIPEHRPAWQLTEETKKIGRAGLRDARAALGRTNHTSAIAPRTHNADFDQPIAA